MIKSVLRRYPPLYGALRFVRNRRLRLMSLVQSIPSRSTNPYATHVPVLVALGAVLPVRRVVELGCGMYSTLTFLDRSVFPHLERLDSFDHDKTWASRVQAAADDDPRLHLVTVDGAISELVTRLPLDGYNLIFVDDSTTEEERAATIRAVCAARPPLGIVVMHDFENSSYRRAAAFPRTFSFSAHNPFTGLAWDQARLDTRRLKHLRRTIGRHAATIPLDDREGWRHVITTAQR